MRQKWGQNFLVDKNTAERIVESLAPFSGPVIEIGPGKGILTGLLAERTSDLTAVELDRDLAAGLAQGWPKVRVVAEDFLEWPFPAGPGPVAFIGNLPYSAANAILRKVLDWTGWDRAVFMVQKEVADRIVAAPCSRDYGILTLAVQGKAEAESLFDVPPRCFQPRPQVTSTVVRLKRWPASKIRDEKKFFRAVRAAFGQRRKTIGNSLSRVLGLEKNAVEDCLKRAGFDVVRRAETFTLEEFNRLAEILPENGQGQRQ
ncbi:MAG TPA: 16S rRNA (adenine(1518)-N(6)/adenine(1519)-N(6))-dimethyltransferase RsmA [Elusimicrobiota bacterium]|nr:16S rRNA (adenine(1518)-N(6)/adenine(1519)-N(6))-dimethyltransferase RsmA [Elusimicrobiota bacterium]